MKNRWLILLMAGIFCLTGCQSAEEKQRTAIQEAFEQMGVEHNEVIMAVLSKEWKVLNSEATYEFTKEGTGNISGETLTYSCGFCEENDIMLQIKMDENGEEFCYFVSADDTGHGLYLKPVQEEEKTHLILANVELLDIKKEASVFIGEWSDKSDNRYMLNDDGTMTIRGADSEKEGTYSVARRDGVELLTLVFGSNTLEFAYEFLDETTVRLCAPGTEIIHTWVKK